MGTVRGAIHIALCFHPRAQECTCFLKMIRTIASIVAPEALRCSIFGTSARQKMVIYEKKMVDLAVGFRLCYDRAAWMCAAFAPSDAGLFFGILLLFAVNPAYSAVAGTLREETFRKCGDFQPRMPFCFYLARGAFFDMGDPAFWGICGNLFNDRNGFHADS